MCLKKANAWVIVCQTLINQLEIIEAPAPGAAGESILCSGNPEALLDHKLLTMGLQFPEEDSITAAKISRMLPSTYWYHIMYVLLGFCFNQILVILMLFLWESWTIWCCGEHEECGAGCRVRITDMNLCYLSDLPTGHMRWLLITVHLCKCISVSEGFVKEVWLPIISWWERLSSLSTSRKAQMIKPGALGPCYLSQAGPLGMVWVLQGAWCFENEVRSKRECLMLEVTRRPSGFHFF